MNLQELLAQKAAIDRQISQARAKSKSDAIATIRKLMEENGLTAADLQEARGKKMGGAVKGATVAPKYRDGTNAWSGRGLRPKWLTAALASGKKIEDFAV